MAASPMTRVRTVTTSIGVLVAGAMPLASALPANAAARTTPVAPNPAIKHTIVGIQSGKCLDVTNFGTANGAQLQLRACNATTNQQWTW